MADGASPVSKETIQALIDLLLDAKKSISERFRALFSLRNLKGQAAVVTALIMAMKDESNLLAHEAAFALGQMQDISAVPALIEVLRDQKGFHPIVRHEAAEALGAIGAEEGLEHLRWALVHDSAQEVRETCELALKRISERHVLGDQGEGNIYSPYLTVDPAMSSALPTGLDDESLKRMLLNEDMPMYDRYAALFALRNRGGEDNVNAIVAALDANSALLRHEVAYVLGQMQDKCSSAALSKTLEDVSEHPMVRHEAAEALGAIADANSIDLLQKFAKDPEPIVHQSCEVALTMLEFERNGNVFEFFFQEILSM